MNYANENISMTRISDLPTEIVSQPIQQNQQNQAFNDSNIYIPLNPHPNPYGISEQPGGSLPPPPQQQYPFSEQPQQMQNQQQYSPQIPQPQQQQQQPEFRLPQRDIPMDITDFTHDEQIQPNYIPKPKLTSDYVERHEKATKTKIREYEENEKKEANVNQLIDQLYQPLVLAFLYFMFQLPIINTLIFKRFSFLSIYNDDGNFNLLGLVLKSSLFASTFFFLQKSTQYFINLF